MRLTKQDKTAIMGMKPTKERCKANTRGPGWRSTRCSRYATINGYCTQHYPPNVDAARKARDEKWKQHKAAAENVRREYRAAYAERDRRAECFDELVAALELLYNVTAEYIRINHLGDTHHNESMQLARDALAKARGES